MGPSAGSRSLAAYSPPAGADAFSPPLPPSSGSHAPGCRLAQPVHHPDVGLDVTPDSLAHIDRSERARDHIGAVLRETDPGPFLPVGNGSLDRHGLRRGSNDASSDPLM